MPSKPNMASNALRRRWLRFQARTNTDDAAAAPRLDRLELTYTHKSTGSVPNPPLPSFEARKQAGESSTPSRHQDCSQCQLQPPNRASGATFLDFVGLRETRMTLSQLSRVTQAATHFLGFTPQSPPTTYLYDRVSSRARSRPGLRCRDGRGDATWTLCLGKALNLY